MPHLLRRTSVLALTLLAACGGDSGGTGSNEPVSRVEISAPAAEVEEGSKLQLSATPMGASGKALSKKAASWTSSNTFVADVNATGEVTGKNPGATTITATVDGVAGTKSLQVVAARVGSVTVQAASVPALTSRPLTLEVRDSRGNALGGRLAVWTSSDESILTVNQVGTVTGHKLGTAQVTATVDGKSGSAPVTVTASTVNFTIAGFYVNQGIQTTQGNIPLIAGRDGWLRVFALANSENQASPRMRVRVSQNGAVVSTMDIAAGSGTVVSSLQEAELTTSWNVRIPAAMVRPGMGVQVEINPAGEIPEANTGDNVFPAAGPQALDVRVSYPHRVVLVPIHQTSTGLTGNITAGDADRFVSVLRKLFPLPGVEAQVRQTFVSNSKALDANDNDGGWTATLNEMSALRIADGSTAYYYGVLKLPYTTGGIAGLGYISGFTAVGYDTQNGGPTVYAHETGHNFSRRHAPCGSVAGADPGYPHAGGTLGAFGIDITDGALKSSALRDIMSYCYEWVSDYTYNAVVNYRASVQSIAASVAAAAAPTRSLLVWGRAGNGRVTLEPAFEITTRPVVPSRSGPYQVEALDESGARIFTHSFAPEMVADLPAGEQGHFAFAIPVSEADAGRIHTLRLVANGRRAERRATLAPRANRTGAEVAGATLRRSGNRMGLRWDANRFPMALVRDVRTGQVISFARGGEAALAAQSGEVEVVFSDGVRSQSRRMRATNQ